MEAGEEDEAAAAADEAEAPRVLAALAGALGRLVSRNERLSLSLETHDAERSRRGVEAFLAPARVPSISVEKYLERIYRYTECSPACFIVGFAYIDRMAHRHPCSLVVSLNVHRLLLTSVLVASKVLDDMHYNNAFFARVGGVSNAELNRLELELLFLLDFGVTVSSRVFESYCFHLEKEMLWGGAGAKIERPISDSLDNGEINGLVDDPLVALAYIE